MNLDNILNNQQNTIDSDMTQSEAGYTTWSQLKKSNDFMQMQRYDDDDVDALKIISNINF